MIVLCNTESREYSKLAKPLKNDVIYFRKHRAMDHVVLLLNEKLVQINLFSCLPELDSVRHRKLD